MLPGISSVEDWSRKGGVHAAIVAVPTSAHADAGCRLLDAGIDVLVEKPIAVTVGRGATPGRSGRSARGRILQVGHLERFNPAVMALRRVTGSRCSSKSTG